MARRDLTNIYLTFFIIFLSSNLDADDNHSMVGYWLTSQSIVLVSECEEKLCATIEHIFVDEGIDQNSILDNNNKEKSLRERTLVGINLIDGFKYIDGAKKLSGGRIYDPGRGRTFKSNIYLLQNGNLKIEGCLLRMCGHEEWKPITVTFNEDGTKKVELKENI